MSKATHALIAGPLVGFAVGVGDGVVGQAHFGDRHDNVRSLYRLGVLGLGAIGLATGTCTEASLGAMSGAAALVGSRVIPAVRGGGWQQFGMVARPVNDLGTLGSPRRRVSEIDADPEPGYGSAPPPVDAPGQVPGDNAERWRGRARAFSVQQSSGLL